MFLAIHIDKNYKANFGWFFVFISTKNVVLFSWNFIPCNPIYRKKLIWFGKLISCITYHPQFIVVIHWMEIHPITITFIHWLSLTSIDYIIKTNNVFGKIVYLQCWLPQNAGDDTHNLTTMMTTCLHVCVFFQLWFVG
jgi:hypothetical protein